MPLANTVISPANMTGNATATKPRAERFSGPVSAKKRLALVGEQFKLRWTGPAYEPEYQFCPVRSWRFDFAWPREKVALEIEGGTWTNGRHNRGSGYIKDCEKYNAAALGGWRVFRLPTGGDVDETIRQLTEAINNTRDGAKDQ